ncbi:MAG: LpqB family beta-propeller domain-containing protein [Gemmatimonadales bacterium]
MLTNGSDASDRGSEGIGDRATPGIGRFRLGDWTLEPAARIVSRGDVEHRLEPKMVDVLMLLIAHAGEVVERVEIENAVWSQAVVGTDVLNRTIWKLRRVLEDDPADPRYIETIPRTGYRLLTTAVAVAAHSPTHGPVAKEEKARFARRSIWAVSAAGAVLAFALVAVWRTETTTADVDLVSTPLTSTPGYEANPAVSPDGRYVAFQRYDPSDSRPSWDVAVMDLTSREEYLLASERGVHEYAPTWSPAGDTVAFVRSGERCGLVLQSLNGPPVDAAECDPDQMHELAWLTDGDLVVASMAPGQTLGLERVRRRTGDRERLTVPPAGFDGDRMPRVSPDGRRIAFVRQRTEGVSDIFVIDLESYQAVAEPSAITSENRRIRGLAWDPPGASILFSSRRGGGDRVWRIPADGGTPNPVSLIGRNAGPLSAAQGLRVYEEYHGTSDLWVYDPSTGAVEPWHESSRSEWGAAISPDGQSVAFVSDRTGSDEIWVIPTRGGEPTRMTQLDGAEVDAPQWHPDSRLLIFAATLYGSYDVFTIDINKGSLERVTDSQDDERNPIWWRGMIVYTADRTGTRELWLLDSEGAVHRRLSSGGAWMAKPSPSGDDLLFTRPGETGVWRLTGLDGDPIRVSSQVSADDGINWCPADAGILVIRSVDGTNSELVLSGTASGEESVLAEIPHEISQRMGISRLPDGGVLVGVIVRSESDLWIAR